MTTNSAESSHPAEQDDKAEAQNQKKVTDKRRERAKRSWRGRGGGVGCLGFINIACAEPAEDAYPSVGAAVMYR